MSDIRYNKQNNNRKQKVTDLALNNYNRIEKRRNTTNKVLPKHGN